MVHKLALTGQLYYCLLQLKINDCGYVFDKYLVLVVQAAGLIAAVGDDVHLKVGTPVALMTFGSYAEFTVVFSYYIGYLTLTPSHC